MAAPKGQGTGEHSGDSLGCGAGRFGVRAAGSLVAGGCWCVWSCTCTPAHVCSGMHGIVLSLEFALGWEGLGILSQGEPLGWFLGLSRQAVPVLGARPASSCPQCLQIPPDSPCSLPQALLWVVPPNCTHCQPPFHWEGSAPFIATSCPF